MTWPATLLTILYCGLIFWLSSQPDPPVIEGLFPQFDKLQHLIAFGLLTALILTGMQRSRWNHSLSRLVWVPFLFTVAFGLTDELHQHFIPGRKVDPFDIVANSTGAFLAQLLFLRAVYGYSFRELKLAARLRRGR